MRRDPEGDPLRRRWRRAGYPRVADFHGCACVAPDRVKASGGQMPPVLPECRYHAAAAANPRDHRIPWNCPTYWDGCNCVVRKLWVRKGKRGRRYGMALSGAVRGA